MSKIKNLRNQLERWRAHNEVHAKPADNELYLVLNGFLELIENTESNDESESISEPEVENNESFTPASDEGEPGGNNPGAPDIP